MQAGTYEELTPPLETILEETPQPEAGLQTPGWAELKAETGWSPQRFWAGPAEARPSLFCQVLVRDLPLGIRMAYAYRGPVWRKGPDRGSLAALVDLLRSEMRSGPTPQRSGSATSEVKNAAFVRVDPAVEKPVGEWLRELGFRKSFEEIQPQTSVIIDLQGTDEELLGRMHQKGRYNIGVSERQGVRVRVGSLDEVEIFAQLLAETSRRQRLAVHSVSYYRRMLEQMGERGELLIADHDGEALGAIVVEYLGRYATYLHGASSDAGRSLMPNYALQWAAMRRARERGCSFYDLRGTAPAEAPESHPYAGLRQFKSKFGGREVTYVGAYDLVLNPLKYAVYQQGQRLRKMKMGLR